MLRRIFSSAASRIVLSAFLIFAVFYVMLPAINLKDRTFITFLIICIGIVLVVNFFSLSLIHIFTPEQQEIIMQAAQDATDYENSETVKVTEANLQDMVDNYGVTVTDPDTTGFIEIADQVAPEYAESIGQLDLYNKIIEALGR